MDLKWERDRISKRLAGEPDAEETTAEVPQPLTKNELKLMLQRNRGQKEQK